MTPRPQPFEDSTPRELWTDPHISEGMLRAHVDPQSDLASPRHDFIDRACAWISSRVELDSSKGVVDFGCGPGLWCERLAKSGARVSGLDFSQRSLSYARENAQKAGFSIEYLECDYLEWQSEDRFDLILMAMYDYCVLDPHSRHRLLTKWSELLKPKGRLYFDVQSLATFNQRRELSLSESQLMGGFWVDGEYQGHHQVFLYPEQKVSLDRFEIVEPHRTRVFHNWMQYFDPESLERDLNDAGLAVNGIFGDLAGSEYQSDSEHFALEVVLG